MKKKLIACLLALALALSLSVPALAYEDSQVYGQVYDGTGMLYTEGLEQLGGEVLPEMVNYYETDLRVDVLPTDNGWDLAYNASSQLVESEGYGYGPDDAGISLTLVVSEDDTGISLEDWAVYTYGNNDEITYEAEGPLGRAMEPMMDPGYWEADQEQDARILTLIVANFATDVQVMMDEGIEALEDIGTILDDPIEDPEQPEEPDRTDGYPSVAGAGEYVVDDAGLLDEEQLQELNDLGAQAEEMGCPLYILTVDDYHAWGYDEAFDAVKYYYMDNGYGINDDRTGMMIMLSMSNRKMGYVAFGYGGTCFTDYGKEYLKEQILDNFADDDWYGGFYDYMTVGLEMIGNANAGAPYDVDTAAEYGGGRTYGVIACIVLAFIIAFIVKAVLKGQLRSVAAKTEAGTYVTSGGVNMHKEFDHYTHTTESRVYNPPKSSSDSGGTTTDSDGASGGSCDF